MAKDNIQRIMEDLMREGSDSTDFSTSLDSINIHAFRVREWDKYKERFGDSEPDDDDTEDFKIDWSLDLQMGKDGIYGVIVQIEKITGNISIKFYDDDSSSEPRIENLEFTEDDFASFKLVNEPKFSQHQQLIINGLDIDFSRKEIKVEYL